MSAVAVMMVSKTRRRRSPLKQRWALNFSTSTPIEARTSNSFRQCSLWNLLRHDNDSRHAALELDHACQPPAASDGRLQLPPEHWDDERSSFSASGTSTRRWTRLRSTRPHTTSSCRRTKRPCTSSLCWYLAALQLWLEDAELSALRGARHAQHHGITACLERAVVSELPSELHPRMPRPGCIK